MPLLKELHTNQKGLVGILEDGEEVRLGNHESDLIVVHCTFRLSPQNDEEALKRAKTKAREDKSKYYFISGSGKISVDREYESAVVVFPCDVYRPVSD